MSESDLQTLPKVFISYRWRDTPQAAEDLERLLALRLGADRVFRDQKDMWAGHDFAQVLEARLQDCGVLLAVIGPQWLAQLAEHAAPAQIDYVRREIAVAFSRGIPVIPVYTGGQEPLKASQLPSDLTGLTGHLYSVLSHWWEDGNQLVEAVGKHLGLSTTERLPWDSPEPSSGYVNRPGLFHEVDEVLNAKRNVVLYGLPGVGKSQAVVQCAVRRRECHAERFQSVFWASADSEDHLAQILRAILVRLGDLPIEDLSQVAVVTAFRRRFEKEADWLFVLDNVEDWKAVHAFFSGWESGHVLLTSRDASGFTWAECLRVDPMGPDEGARLLLHQAKRLRDSQDLADAAETDRDAAREISRRVGGLPLALDQAGGYISRTPGVSPASYLILYDAERAELLQDDPEAKGERASVWTTFKLAFEALKDMPKDGALAADLLRLCAFFAPDPIPTHLLAIGSAAVGGDFGAALTSGIKRNALIRAAAGFSLLSVDDDQAYLHVHRLIRDIIQEIIPQEERATWAARAVAVVNHCLPDPTVDADAFQWVWPHAVAALDLMRDFALPAGEQSGAYSLDDFSADLRVQRALKNGDSWEQLFGVDDIHYADLAWQTLHKLERKETSHRLRRIIASLHRMLPDPVERRRAFACMYFVAHYWWDWYLRTDDICPPLLEMWEQSNTGVERTEEEADFLQALKTINADYPSGREYRTRNSDPAAWESLGEALLRLRALLNLDNLAGLALSPGGRYVRAITNLYLAEVKQYAPDAVPDLAGDRVWDLYTQASTLLHLNGDTFHENWSFYEHAKALREAGQLRQAWEKCLQALGGILGEDNAPSAEKADEDDGGEWDDWDTEEEGQKNKPDHNNEESENEDIDSELITVIYRVMADILWETPKTRPQAWMYYSAAALAALAFVLSEGDAYAVALYDEMRDRVIDRLADPALSSPEQEAAGRLLAAFWADYWVRSAPVAPWLPPTPPKSRVKPPEAGADPSATRRQIAHIIAAMPSRLGALDASSPHSAAPEHFARVLADLGEIEA